MSHSPVRFEEKIHLHLKENIYYAIRQKTKRTYAKSAATDTSYEVKVSIRLLCLNEIKIIFCKY